MRLALPTLALLCCALAADVRAQPAESRLAPNEVAAFADAFFGAALAADRFPGAAFAVVQDGEVIFAQGYGVADSETGQPVDAAATLFPVASVTKLFTATAVMQLVEAGTLDLHADVARYVDVPVHSELGPVTLAHLLTHTSGHEDRNLGIGTVDAAQVPPLDTYLRREVPTQVRPPGTILMYSNYGYTLAGYVVERAAGRPFAEYMREHILAPLDMHRARLNYQAPLGDDTTVSRGHAANVVLPELHLAIWPAGSLQATANEIAHFMIAHLMDGRFGDRQILSRATVTEMQRRQFSHHERLAGWTYGFAEHTRGPTRAILHDGDLPGFNSRLFLIPERRLGFFVVNNGSDMRLRIDVTDAFIEQLVPAAFAAGDLPARATASEILVDGHYRSARYPRTSADKLAGVVLEFRVRRESDGAVTLFPPPIPGLPTAPTRWLPVGPMLFRHAERDEHIVFRAAADGHPAMLFAPLFGTPWSYEAIGWLESLRVQASFVVVALLAFLSAALGWPAAALVRRLRARRAPLLRAPGESRRGALLARVAAGIGAGAMLTFFVAAGIAFPSLIEGGAGAAVYLVFALPLIALVPIAIAAWWTFRAWREQFWGAAARVHFTVVVLALILFVPFLSYWNLLGFRF